MSNSDRRHKAQVAFERDLTAWECEARQSAGNPPWDNVIAQIEWMRDRIRRPGLVPMVPRMHVNTVLVPKVVYDAMRRDGVNLWKLRDRLAARRRQTRAAARREKR